MVARSWNSWNEMVTLRAAMNQLLEGSFVRPGTAVLGASAGTNTLTFPINVYGTADELKVEALLPGVSPEDVQVDVDRGVLTIAAKRHGWEPGAGQNWYAREISSGQFARSLSLPFPVEVEHATADFANGVLTLTLPKAEAAKPKRIQIGGAQAQEQLASTAQH
jgi:HSP20 family protein